MDSNGKRKIVILSLIVFAVAFVSGVSIVVLKAATPIGPKSIQQSHIDANEPEKKGFDELLTKDLESHFNQTYNKKIIVKHELLRKGATQSGTALPKYYVWVTLFLNGEEFEQGAVRVAAIEKESFTVLEYLTRKQIKEDPDKVYKIFPKEVAAKLLQK
jgi:hypothetical protein